MKRNQEYFERVEKKYLLSKETAQKLVQDMQNYIQKDSYPYSQIMNIYYDTIDHKLIKDSLEKPIYKEKLRLRSYHIPMSNEEVYLELKKKYEGVVYKRRCKVCYDEVYDLGGVWCYDNQQIGKELDYFIHRFEVLKPAAVICYQRFSYVGINDSDVRITFDDHILMRERDLDLRMGVYGKKIVDEDKILMEVKVRDAIPLWLVRLLDFYQIYPISFSKYGQGYQLYRGEENE